MRKPVLCHMWTSKVQISLRILAAWSAPIHCLDRILPYLLSPKFQDCSWAGLFESYLVGNPEDRFCRDVAQLSSLAGHIHRVSGNPCFFHTFFLNHSLLYDGQSFFLYQPHDLYHFHCTTSSRVWNGLQWIPNLSIPHYIPDILHDTVTKMYDFLEAHSYQISQAQQQHLPSIPIRLILPCNFIDDTLVEAMYLPDYLTHDYTQSIEFQQTSDFLEDESNPPISQQDTYLTKIHFWHEYTLKTRASFWKTLCPNICLPLS